jgi:transposase InsO family protein
VFEFIAAKRAEHPVKTMCRVLGVSRSGFHAWATREPSARALADAALTVRIAEIHAENRKVYGSPRIHAELALADGVRVGRKRVERLMRAAGLSGLIEKKWRKTTIRVPGVRVCEDLVDRAFWPALRTASGSPTSPTCDLGRLALLGRRPGRLLAANRRLGDGRPYAHRARHRRAADGSCAPTARPWADLAFRSGQQPWRVPELRSGVIAGFARAFARWPCRSSTSRSCRC